MLCYTHYYLKSLLEHSSHLSFLFFSIISLKIYMRNVLFLLICLLLDKSFVLFDNYLNNAHCFEDEFICKMDAFLFTWDIDSYLLLDYCTNSSYAYQSEVIRYWLWTYGDASEFSSWSVPFGGWNYKIDPNWKSLRLPSSNFLFLPS